MPRARTQSALKGSREARRPAQDETESAPPSSSGTAATRARVSSVGRLRRKGDVGPREGGAARGGAASSDDSDDESTAAEGGAAAAPRRDARCDLDEASGGGAAAAAGPAGADARAAASRELALRDSIPPGDDNNEAGDSGKDINTRGDDVNPRRKQTSSLGEIETKSHAI